MPNRKREAEVRDRLAQELRDSGHINVVTEYKIEADRSNRVNRYVDILCRVEGHTFVVEIKQASRYHHAIGQAIASAMLLRAKTRKEPRMVVVLYGTLYELTTYEAEARLVLQQLESAYGLHISFLTEVA